MHYVVFGRPPDVPSAQLPDVLESLAERSADLLALRSRLDDAVVPVDEGVAGLLSALSLESRYSLEEIRLGGAVAFVVSRKDFFLSHFSAFVDRQEARLRRRMAELDEELELLAVQRQLLALASDMGGVDGS